MIAARLIAATRPVADTGLNTGEDLIAYCARVSNPANQNNPDTMGLLRYLIRHLHWSPFEMAHAVVEVECPRDIARQILRHRSFSFQEFCVAGNTLVTFDLPGALRKGKRQSHKRPIAKLYEMQQAGKPLPSMTRVFDEASRTFTNAPIREVFQAGVKPTFRVTLENGRAIECTKEHRFLTENGFMPLEDAIGLRVIGSTAVMTRPDTMLACNGVAAYQDAEWMAQAKAQSIKDGTGIAGIAEAAGVTVHTIRKWLRRLSLQFTKKEVASYSPIWNKGARGYKLGPHAPETIEKMRASAKRGPESNLWRGGADRSERLRIADWCTANRADFLRAANYQCQRCGDNHRLEMHHIATVADRPDLAYEPSNIEVLCKSCHREHHNLNGDQKMWRERSKGRTLTIHWSKVRHVEYIGEQMTYDLEVEHASHNFVGNGIVVHNSQRYAEVLADPEFRQARLQDHKNRQSSIQTDDAALHAAWMSSQVRVWDAASEAYKAALAAGIAKEVARALLPEGLTPSRLYMAGSLRSFIHYLDVREGNGTQAEHVEVARAIRAALVQEFPNVMGLAG